MTKYEAVLIDNDNTIMDFSACSKSALGEVIPKGADLDYYFDLYTIENDRLWAALERGEITREKLQSQRFISFKQMSGLDFHPSAAAEKYKEALSNKFYFMPGAESLLELLSKRTKLYMVSNGIASVQRRRIEGSGAEKFFDGIFISEEIGGTKPDKAFFDKVLSQVSVPPEKILMIGDSISADIIGGINAGIDTCWITLGRELPQSIKPTYVVRDIHNLLKLLIDKKIYI